jgi:hypothetical protein
MGLIYQLCSSFWGAINNAGSGDAMSVSFFPPKLPSGEWYILGTVASQMSFAGAGSVSSLAPAPCFATIIVQPGGNDPTAIAAPSAVVQFVRASTANTPYYLYYLIPPAGYVSIGILCVTSATVDIPTFYACIRQDLVSPVNPQSLLPTYCSLSNDPLVTPMPYGLWTLPISGCLVPSFGVMGTTTQGPGLTTYQWSPPSFPVYDLPPLPAEP